MQEAAQCRKMSRRSSPSIYKDDDLNEASHFLQSLAGTTGFFVGNLAAAQALGLIDKATPQDAQLRRVYATNMQSQTACPIRMSETAFPFSHWTHRWWPWAIAPRSSSRACSRICKAECTSISSTTHGAQTTSCGLERIRAFASSSGCEPSSKLLNRQFNTNHRVPHPFRALRGMDGKQQHYSIGGLLRQPRRSKAENKLRSFSCHSRLAGILDQPCACKATVAVRLTCWRHLNKLH